MRPIVVIDNYDSFTYNLVQYLGELAQGRRVKVFRNDEISVSELERNPPSHLVISPGPGTPERAGVSVAAIQKLAGRIPILGVCLGHQAVGIAFGGKIGRARRLMHGKLSEIFHDRKGVFRGLPNPFSATRYHSLIVEERGLGRELEISARAKPKAGPAEIMGLRHKRFIVEGVQFHPESILTEAGKRLLANFLSYRRGTW